LLNRVLYPWNAQAFRHLFTICFLTFFIASAQTISLWYIPFFLGYLVLSALWLLAGAGVALTSSRSNRWTLTVFMFIYLITSCACFAVTPRVRPMTNLNPLAAIGLVKLVPKSSHMGFTESVSLGLFGELKKSRARVMRLKPFEDVPEGTQPGPVLVRGTAFDLFDGKNWRKSHGNFYYRKNARLFRSFDGRAWVSCDGNRLFFPGDSKIDNLPGYEVTLNPTGYGVLFTVGALRMAEEIQEPAYFDYTDSVYFAVPPSAGLRYKIYIDPNSIGFGKSYEKYPELVRKYFLQLPQEDPELRQLALKITGKSHDDAGKVKAVQSYLRRNFQYALDASVGHPTLKDFLLKSRRGNCEYFASGAVILLRHLGIPARLVAGFLAKEWNEYGKFYDVRQDQAHAWAEAYLPERGWVVVDATPAERVFPQAAAALFNRIARYIDAVQQSWYRDILGYDYVLQRSTFQRLGLKISREAVGHFLVKGFIAGLGATVFWWIWVFFKDWRQKRLSQHKGFFFEAQRMLEKAGLPRGFWLSPREYALQVSLQRPELAPVLDLAELHYVSRYSPGGISSEERHEAEKMLSSLRLQIQAS